MVSSKSIHELTIKDNFMFGAVMCNEKHCKRFLEMIFGFPIAKVEVSMEKCLIYHPEYKGVRLDVYAQDEHNTRYNIEMQAIDQSTLAKRTRYYHCQIDMDLLGRGAYYSELPKAYVIFVCDFDPFKEKKYCYTFRNICAEDRKTELDDGSISIFLSTKGENADEVPEAMVKFLTYVGADLSESEKEFDDDFVKSLQETVTSIKSSREMEGRYMTLKDMLYEERTEGRAEGREEGKEEGRAESQAALQKSILENLDKLGAVSDCLKEKISAVSDIDELVKMILLTAKVDSIEQFEKSIE